MVNRFEISNTLGSLCLGRVGAGDLETVAREERLDAVASLLAARPITS